MLLSYYMDESVSGAITEQLQLRGIDVIRAQDENEGAADETVLDRATELGRILITQDRDHVAIGTNYQRNDREFAGIVYIYRPAISIGRAVEDLTIIAHVASRKELSGLVVHLPI